MAVLSSGEQKPIGVLLVLLPGERKYDCIRAFSHRELKDSELGEFQQKGFPANIPKIDGGAGIFAYTFESFDDADAESLVLDSLPDSQAVGARNIILG